MNMQSLIGQNEVKLELQYEFNDASYIRVVCIKNGMESVFFRPRMVQVAERHEIGVIDTYIENEIEIFKKYSLTICDTFIDIKSCIKSNFHINDNEYVYSKKIVFNNTNFYIIPSSLPEYISIIISNNLSKIQIGSTEYDFDDYYFD